MSNKQVPVIFCVYNRPDLTKKTFLTISNFKPKVLFLISDGPKNVEDEKSINEVRSIISKVNWQCKVFKRFRKRNVGNKISCTDGINWLFSKYDEMIYIEDDTLPSQDFFNFAIENLKKYKNYKNIISISAQNEFSNELAKYKYSYYFSSFIRLPPFATWKRAWNIYDKNVYKSWLNNVFSTKYFLKFNSFLHYLYFSLGFNWGYIKAIDTWDFVWHCSLLTKTNFKPLSIIPAKNLSINIGMNHKKASRSVPKSVELLTEKMKLERIAKIKHTNKIIQIINMDKKIFANYYLPYKNMVSLYFVSFFLILRFFHSFYKILKYKCFK